MDLTAAFEACRKNNHQKIESAFLLFQLGPVQDFIAAARSTRDLWSGSYLISWLSAHAIKAVTDETGPSSIIFPALRGLGIFDAVNREIFENVSYQDKNSTEKTLWKRLYEEDVEPLLNPTVPNRFLALIPASRAEELAKKAELAVHKELARIGEHCFNDLEKIAGKDIADWRSRWDKQLELLPQITWQTLPFEDDIDAALKTLEKIAPEQAERLQTFKTLAEKDIPESERDGRNYQKCTRCDKPMDQCTHTDKEWKLSRPEFAWSANFAHISLLLAARRNTREFASFFTDENQEGTPKDALTGKEEIIGDEKFWKNIEGKNGSFKKNEGPYGAMNIIKRLWCEPKEESYLSKALNIDLSYFRQTVRFKSTKELAGDDKYFAILAMDGDKMGEWISGDKTPLFLDQLKGNAREYFEKLNVSAALRRQVSPGFHLQFSEALANFSNQIAGKIVEKHGGSLIYAGGDDVLAALPAKAALKCASELRTAFRGENGWTNQLEGRKDLIMVPGKLADVSCGIAVAHSKYPLQRAVEEARQAEHRAKNDYDRGAFAVSLLKRGGETIHWGAKWDDEALPLFHQYCKLRQEEKDQEAPVSGRFPYALASVLTPYQLETKKFVPNFDPRAVIENELELVLERQVDKATRNDLKESCLKYLDKINTSGRWEDFVKLFLTAAFIERDRGE